MRKNVKVPEYEKPVRMPNAEEMELRVSQVAQWLAEGHRKCVIKRRAFEKWGIKYRAADSLLQRAREMLRKHASESIRDAMYDSLEVYRTVIRDPSAAHRDRIMAQTRIDAILGTSRESFESQLKEQEVVPGGIPRMEYQEQVRAKLETLNSQLANRATVPEGTTVESNKTKVSSITIVDTEQN